MSSRGAVQRKKISKSARAGLIFPVTRVARYLRKSCLKYRIQFGSPIYLSAALEYLVAEVLELAGNAAHTNKKRKISPRHILLAVANDEELNKLFKGVTISQGGVLPHVNEALIPRATKQRAVQRMAAKYRAKKGKKPGFRPLGNSNNVIPTATVSTTAKKAKGSGHTILGEKILNAGQKLTVVQGDISKIACDAVIHPTNSSLSTSGQCGSALSQVGGASFRSEVNRISKANSLSVSKAVISGSGSLPCNWVIHVHSPGWGSTDAIKMLEEAVKSCLDLAEESKLASVAFPSIASGSNSFPKQTAAQTILRCIKRYYSGSLTNASSVKQVFFVLYDLESVNIYTSELDRLDLYRL